MIQDDGLLSLDSVRFIRGGVDNGHDFKNIIENPRSVADTIGQTLSAESEAEIKMLLDPSLIESSLIPSTQVISALNKILLDGRFIDTWRSNLEHVFSSLNIPLTPELRDELKSVDVEDLLKQETEGTDVSVVTTAAGVVAAVAVGAAVAHGVQFREEPILDFSNVPKF